MQRSLATPEFTAGLALFRTDPDAKTQYELGKLLLERGHAKEPIEHLEAAARLTRQRPLHPPSAPRRLGPKESRIAEADCELELYKKSMPKGESAPRHNRSRAHDILLPGTLLIAFNSKHLANSFLLSLLSANLAFAQGGHPTPSPPPPGAKSIKCSGRPIPQDRKSTRLNSSHLKLSRMPSSA